MSPKNDQSKFQIAYSVILLVLFLSNHTTLAQENFLFERLFINDGLSNNSVNSILQTRDGFLWVATKDGINRYDGQGFKTFKNIYGDTTSLPENYVMSLAESRDGVLWVGTWGRGLQIYDRVNECFISKRAPSSKDQFIQCIFEDHDMNIWFGTTEGGLFRLFTKTGQFENYAKDLSGTKPFVSNNVTCIVEDFESHLWVGTWDAGLVRLNPEDGSFTGLSHDPKNISTLASNGVWDISIESDSSLLLSTFSGLDRLDLISGDIVHNPGIEEAYSSILSNTIRQTLRDRKGGLWIGTYDYFGLFLNRNDENGDSKTIRFINEDDNDQSISIDRIRCIYEDLKGNIWIGTENGLNKLPVNRPFRQYKYFPVRPNSLGGRVVSSISQSKNGCLWVGYGGGGFDKLDPIRNTVRHYKNDPSSQNSLSSDDVISLYEAKDGCLWVCTADGGINSFDPTTGNFRSFTSDPGNETSITSNWVLQVLETSGGLFLVGTNSGLEVLNRETGKFHRFTPDVHEGVEKLSQSISVNVLYEDRVKNIWIGTWLDGIFCYNPSEKTLHQYIHDAANPYSISSDKITAIYEDSLGLWIGTHSGGLNRLDLATGKFNHFNTQNGMPNDVIFGILGDSKSNLWVSTMNGLAKMNLSTGVIRVYDELDGLVDNQFNWRASHKDQRGNIYFGGINGFISFHPDSIHIDTVPPLVAITNFTVFNKKTGLQQDIPPTREIVLDYDQNFFSIDFTALDMAPLQKHEFAYMLEGIDQNWVYSGTRNIAYYTNLHKGAFSFLIKASNADGIWSEAVSLQISILPAWWNTLWIKILGLLTIFIIGIIVARLRFWHLLDIERIRLNIASDLHDEMGSNLSSISVDSQQLMLLNEKKSKGYELSSDIFKTTNETIDSIRDIIWFINPKNDGDENMLFKMREKAATMLAGIDWSFDISEGLKLDSLKLVVRRNIFLIYRETLTNIVRHSKAESCTIVLRMNASMLELKICDDGLGFNLSERKINGGLSNLYYRAKKIGARIEISSNPGKGTCVILELAIKSHKRFSKV